MSTDSRGHEALRKIADVEMPPLKYYELVAQFNILLQNELTTQLSKIGRKDIHVAYAIGTPGSDGRQEAGSYASPYEGFIVTDADVDLPTLEKSIKKLVEQAAPGRIVSFETKGPRSALRHYRGDPKIVQPARALEARHLFGDRGILESMKRRAAQELIEMHSREVERVRGLRQDALRVTGTGKNQIAGQDAVHFDLSTGTVFFNPKGNTRSFKVGPLRLVQNTLLVEQVRHARKEKDTDFLTSLHSGIVNRLGQLSDDKMLSVGKSFVQELQEHYAFFLRLYHQSEHAYTTDGSVARQLSPTEVNEVAKRLVSLQELTLALKIEKQKALPKKK